MNPTPSPGTSDKKTEPTSIWARAYSVVSSVFEPVVDFTVTRAVILSLSMILYLVATSTNLQIRATFSETNSGFERVFSTLVIAAACSSLFYMRRNVRRGVHLAVDLLVHTLPVVLTAFALGWNDQGAIGASIFMALHLIMLATTLDETYWHHASFSAFAVAPLGGFIAFYLLITYDAVGFGRLLGAGGLVLLFVAMLAVLIQGLTRVPRVLTAILVFIAVTMANHELQHHAENRDVQPFLGNEWPIHDAFAWWLAERQDLDYYRENALPYPVLLVTSEGGGGYALAHAFTFLDKMSERCPAFNHHLFAMIGVSGGQVGNTLYHANMETPVLSESTRADPRCTTSADVDNTEYLSTDHLSPLIAHLLFVEIPHKLLWRNAPERGRTLTLLDSLNSVDKNYAPIPDTAYWEHFWTPDPTHEAYFQGGKPALVSVTTDADTGNRFVFTPFPFSTHADDNLTFFRHAGDVTGEFTRRTGPTLGSATLASASFPWVTPSLRFTNRRAYFDYLDNPDGPLNADPGATGPAITHAVNLVDGGYFENTGAETLSEIIASLTPEDLNQVLGADCRLVESPYSSPTTSMPRPQFCQTHPDCSGVTPRPLLRLIDGVEWGACEIPFFPVAILIRDTGQVFESGAPQSFLYDPIKTMLRARSARAAQSISLLEERKCGFADWTSCWLEVPWVLGDPNPQLDYGAFQSLIHSDAMDLPLGWNLEPRHIETINTHVVPDANICAGYLTEEGDPMAPATRHTDDTIGYANWMNCSNVRQMIKLFDAEAVSEALLYK